MTKSKAGRPSKKKLTSKRISEAVSKMTEANVNKLKEVFALDGTIAEACFYTGISRQTYYDWIKRNPKLIDKFNALREKPILKARMTVVKSLDHPDYAFKYLERKTKEFNPKIDIYRKDPLIAERNHINILINNLNLNEKDFEKENLAETMQKLAGKIIEQGTIDSEFIIGEESH